MAGPPTRETQRLLLRAYRPADAEPLYRIQGDPEAMQYTWCAPSLEAAEARLEVYAVRFAPWTAVSRTDGAVVGWGGLCVDPFATDWGTEVSYFIAPDRWGAGLAGEIVAASVQLGLEALELPHVDAFAMPANQASIRVLEREGFRFVDFVAELERNRYRIGSA